MFIPYKFTQLNDYIDAERTNKFMASAIKKRETEVARLCSLKQGTIDRLVKIRFIWSIKNVKVDPDNIAFAKKFILDGMVKAGLLKNDTHRYIKGFIDDFWVGDEEGVSVLFIDVDENGDRIY